MRFRLVTPVVLLASTFLSAQSPSLRLVPMPREAIAAATLTLPAGIRLTCAEPCDPEDAFALSDLRDTLAQRGIPTTNAANAPHILVLRYNTSLGRQAYTDSLSPGSPRSANLPADFAAEGYAIVPDRNGKQDAGLALTADTASGIFYALQTVKQLITGNGSTAILQIATIRDWPAMKYRGLQDDLSRGPVSSLEFQKKLVRTLASYKANLYSPYFEHTQQYASNPLPAPPGGSISAADARELVAYGRLYHVMIVPEQEAFGHLRHALIWEQYQQVAETPHGAVLAPSQPGSLKLISQEFTELAQLYPSPFLHVGADETEDLGRGQSKDAVDAQGLGPVYLNFMQQIDSTLRPLNRRLLFWGDIAENSPDLLKGMPASFKKDTIAISWHYNPSPTGFMKYLNYFTSAGFETWVAPGINNWNRIYPNNNLALPNIQQFTRDGQTAGATGQLNTIWYDDGEALASNNWYGILFGAAAAWQKGESSIPQFEQSYGQVFHGDQTGKLNQAQLELTAAHDLLRNSAYKGDGTDLLFWADPFAPDQQKNFAALRPVLSELRLHAERALTLIAEARATAPAASLPVMYSSTNTNPSNPTSLREADAIDALELGARRFDFIGLKFQTADEISDAYAHAQSTAAQYAAGNRRVKPSTAIWLGDINGVNGRIQDIKDGYALLRDLYEQAWLRTNRPYALRNILEHYDYTIGIWLSRMDKVRGAQRQWENTRTLPTNSDVGIPVPAH